MPDEEADLSEFPCFACGGKTVPLGLSRFCIPCQVQEIRWLQPYVPHVRTVEHVPCGDWEGLPYLDHSAGHYPAPA